MEDSKLLEFAGLAAGETYTKERNPLERDDLALRLAVKLNLFVFHGWTHAEGVPLANVVVDNAEQTVPSGEIKGDDPYAATRRAIVRAAAEIGRSKA